MTQQAVLPGTTANGQQTTLGVMGGGQLGRMFVQAAQRMGYFTAVLDPDPASPAGLVSHYHVQADYLDEQALAQMMQRCAAITTEFENVPAGAMFTLGAHRPVAPSAQCLAIAQDRIREKAHFRACGVPTAPYAVITTAEQLAAVDEALLPGILKTAQLGYDGKGQVRVADRADLAAAWEQLRGVPCVLERRLDLHSECSVIVARGWDGAMVTFPVQRNLHVAGILAMTEVFDGNLPAKLAEQARTSACAIARELEYVGVLCVEFFVVADASVPGGSALLVNEIAPRPHNSGHYTLDACDHSQFDLQVHALAGLPLPAPRQHSPAVMLNLLGDLWFARPGEPQPADAQPRTPDWESVLALPGAHLHLYGKLRASRGRKMGHLTLTGATQQQVRETAQQAARMLGIALA
ncbi:5-(carboxyamino)imidazole ribonucleotide synthase [Comamonadaceae bacterium G21597-S1]|nr:5-(carboxyamino)imidazole ribonucleotide synthase [Comamonadaceae bacterium G21597-S1]